MEPKFVELSEASAEDDTSTEEDTDDDSTTSSFFVDLSSKFGSRTTPIN